MTPTLRHIPFRDLGASGIHLRYLEEDRDLVEFLGMRPRDPDAILRNAATNARRLVPPEPLGAALLAYAQLHGAPEPVLENARAIGAGEALVTVTGQQPGLFGGPLYSLHKAATAVRLARELSARPGAPQVVPLFWNHTDDHDLDEANRAFMVNANQELQRFRLPLTHSGKPLRTIAAGAALEGLLATASDLLPDSEFREEALAPFRPRHPDEPLGDSMARLIFSLFGRYGMVVIEPRDLPPQAFEVLNRWWKNAGAVRERLRATCDHLTDRGVDVTLDPGATLMFQISGGRRVPLGADEQVDRPTDLSPGVILRPLWQDACLPTVGSVVGPGELSYLAVAGPLYRTLGVPFPILIPRASLTLVEPSQKRLLKRFGWEITDLGRGIETLGTEIVEQEGEGIDQDLEDIAAGLAQRLGEVTDTLKKRDPQMVGQARRCQSKTVEEVRKLAQRVLNSRQNREGTGIRQVRRLCNNLRPRCRLQERVLNILPYLVAHGNALADELVNSADPFAMDHGVLEL